MEKGIHYCYLISGKSDDKFTLLNEENIKKIYHAFEPISKFIEVKKAKISAIQIAIGIKGYVKIGRPKWNLDDLEKICTNYKSYPDNDFSFTTFDVEFPSVVSAYKNGTTTQLKLDINNDMFYGKDYGSKNCGIVLSVREDIFEQTGEAVIHEFLKQICAMLEDSIVLFIKRDFFGKGVSMMDASSWRYQDKMYNKEYKDWQQIEL